MKLNKKYFWNIVLIVSITAIAMYFSLKDNFSEIVDAIARMNPFMLVLVLCWGILYTSVWGVSYQVLARRYKKGYSLLQGIIVSFVGSFFSGITPSATGGQFGQAYVLKKQGISYADGASLLWADFIIYQTTMMLYVTVLFILRFSHYANLSSWFWIVFAGYVVNLVVVIGLYTIALFPNFYIKLARWGVTKLGKWHFLKNPDKTLNTAMRQVNNFTREIKVLSQDWPAIIKCMLVNFLRLTLYYSIPYVIANGIGIALPITDLVDVMTLSSFVTMANSFIPLPGASGGTEVVFTLLFSRLFGTLTGAVMLLWRFSTYYIPVMVGALIFILFKNHNDAKKEMEEQQEQSQSDGPGKSTAFQDGVQKCEKTNSEKHSFSLQKRQDQSNQAETAKPAPETERPAFVQSERLLKGDAA